MAFDTISYLLFLTGLFLLFLVCPDRFRWLLLLAASFIFYGFFLNSLLLFVLLEVIFISFLSGRLIEGAKTSAEKKKFLWLGVSGNLSLLISLKYLPHSPPLVSIGVSFYVFQAISYLIDIYYRMVKAESHFGYFALYLSFFPKLLQGPIERANDLLPQLKIKYTFNYDNFRFGLLLFSWGLFKKIVIADRLDFYVNAVYNHPHLFTGLPLLLSTYAYALQIYMDFSGYTDMALGSARLFNINLTQNFNSPYLAASVIDFWRRWHITLSRWIFDYLFEPLQMKFRSWGKWGTSISLIITFLICGIWHGAKWTFLIFGLLHGLFLACSFFYRPFQKKLYKFLGIEKNRFFKFWKIVVTFNLISFAFVFFRSSNLADAFYIITNMFIATKGSTSRFLLSHGSYELMILFIVIFIYLSISAMIKRFGFILFMELSVFKKCLVVYSLLTIIMILAKFKHSDFIYFRF